MGETKYNAFETYVGLIGITYRRTHAEALAYFQLPDSDSHKKAPLVALAHALQLSECVFLATCNRVELWFVAPKSLPVTTVRRRFVAYMASLRPTPPPLEARQLHAYADEGAWERLFVIASALDAMVPGEAQVLGQLKAAVRTSERHGLLGPTLAPLVQAAIVAAKDVRENTALGRGRTSMMSLIEDYLNKALLRHGAAKPVVAVIGTGEMACACAERLSERDDIALTIVSRTLVRAKQLAARLGATAQSLEEFCRFFATSSDVAAVLSATTCNSPIFDAAFFAKFAADQHALPINVRPTFVDLGVPQNIDARAAKRVNVVCVDYPALIKLSERHRAERNAILADARARIDVQLDALAHKMQQKRVKDAVCAWREHCEQVLQQRLLSLPKGAHEDALWEWARKLTQALAHAPTLGLKHMAHAVGDEAVLAFVRGAKFIEHER